MHQSIQQERSSHANSVMATNSFTTGVTFFQMKLQLVYLHALLKGVT